MLTSITPLGERGRASRWSVTVVAYLLGSVVGGLAVGLLAGAVGRVLPLENAAVASLAVVVLGMAGVFALLVELRRLPAPPTLRRQVDEDWLHRYRGWVYGVGYGAQLGFGLVTIVTSTSLYVALLLALLTGSLLGGAVVGGVFGLVRALPVFALRHVHTASQLTAAARRTEGAAPLGRRVAAAAMAAVTAAATVQLVVTGAAA
jgi:MFS family permease